MYRCFSQSVTLTFTAKDAANQYVQLNRVVVTNVSQNWQETLYWPDTVLTMTVTGIHDVEALNFASLQLSQNNPNPFNGITYASLTVAKAGAVTVEIVDVTGRVVATREFASLQQGTHQLHVCLSTAGLYFLTASMNGQFSSIKMVNRGKGSTDEIVLNDKEETQLIASASQTKNTPKASTTNPFASGVQMEYMGYATINGAEAESQHIMQSQTGSQTFTLQFDETQIPFTCGSSIVTDYDGNIYNTVQIGNQCWMKENLRTTHYANGTSIALGSSTSFSTAYRYYPDNDSSNVSTYGYLYNWKAVMDSSSSSSSNPSGVQGICPTGWHVPSDAEWTQLTDYVSSQSQYVCGISSYNIAKALASTTGWNNGTGTCAVGNNPSANNATGFSAFPAGDHGFRYNDFGDCAHFWSATESSGYTAYSRLLYYGDAYVGGGYVGEDIGFSLRCLRD